MDKTMDLANQIGNLLSGHELDDVMPALAIVLAHAASMSNLPPESIVNFIEKALRFQHENCDGLTKH